MHVKDFGRLVIINPYCSLVVIDSLVWIVLEVNDLLSCSQNDSITLFFHQADIQEFCLFIFINSVPEDGLDINIRARCSAYIL